MLFLGNLKSITQEGNMKTRQMTPFFFIYVLRSKCLYHSFLYLKIVKIHFDVVPPFWSILCFIPRVEPKKVSAHGLKVIGVSDVLTWVACYYYCYCYYWNTDNLEKKVECLLLRQKWKNASNPNRSEQWFKRRTWLEELVLLYINWTGNATILDNWLPMWTNMLWHV